MRGDARESDGWVVLLSLGRAIISEIAGEPASLQRLQVWRAALRTKGEWCGSSLYIFMNDLDDRRSAITVLAE